MLFLILIPKIGAGDNIEVTLPARVLPTLALDTIELGSSVGSGHHSLDPFLIGPGGPSQLNALELDARHIKFPSPRGKLNDNCSFGCFNPAVVILLSSLCEGIHLSRTACSPAYNSLPLVIPGALLGLPLNIPNGV